MKGEESAYYNNVLSFKVCFMTAFIIFDCFVISWFFMD